MTPIRVAIVDDHPALREGTASLLAREPDIEVISTVGTVEDCVALSQAPDPPDVVLLDIRLGDESGFRMLSGDRPTDGRPSAARPAIIVWTGYDFPQYAAFAYRSGAAGFLVKTVPTAELVEAIRRVAGGGLHFSNRPDVRAPLISDRERDVLERLVGGRSNDEIGSDLGITTRAVEAHLTRLFERFDSTSRTELATRAVREGWLDLPKLPAG